MGERHSVEGKVPVRAQEEVVGTSDLGNWNLKSEGGCMQGFWGERVTVVTDAVPSMPLYCTRHFLYLFSSR